MHLQASKPQTPLTQAMDSLFAKIAITKLATGDMAVAKRRQTVVRFAASASDATGD